MKKIILLLLATGLLFACCEQPKKEKTEMDVDTYLWLEDIEGEKPIEWVKEQNVKSEDAFANLPLYESLKNKYLDAFNDKDKIAYPSIVGDYVYNLWQDEINERGVWRRMSKTDFISNKSNWEVVIDIDKLSEKENRKWVFKGAEWLEPDNKFCLVTLSDGGTDKSEVREFNAKKKEFVADGFYVEESKGGSSWMDKNTILVTKDYGEGSLSASGYPIIAKKWKRGTDIGEATTVFEAEPTVAGVWPYTFRSNGKQYAFIYVWITSFETELHYINNGKVQKLDFPLDAQISGFHKNQMILALQSDWTIDDQTFSAGSLVSFDLDEFLSGEKNLKTVYQPDQKSSFISMSEVEDFVVVNTMENVQNKLIKYSFQNGDWVSEAIEAPVFGSIFMITSGGESNDYFFQYSNLVTPSTLYYGDEKGIQVTKKLKATFDADNLVVKQYETTSKDGTTVPYFIVHKNDMELNGKNPTLVYAYGGFNNAEQPYYSSTRGIGWMEQGCVYVLANIRGGGEFGPTWHQGAMKEKRQNAYDDFYAVSEDLIKRKITSPEHLGAYGWSNGGLLAGVVFTQRPDLFNAVVIGAPLLDMKRYSKMLAGASWVGEYGDPDNPEEWAYLQMYSPYHNVYEDKDYPEVLFVTSTKDDRVHPGHARKMAAKMMDMGHPLYYHETIEGGHGAASTNNQQAEMWAMIYTYLNTKLKDSQ